MPRGIASAKQLAMMTKVLDAYCRERGIEDVSVRESLGQQLLKLFDQGKRTEDDLAAALKDDLGPGAQYQR
jgi:hypothetical protein